MTFNASNWANPGQFSDFSTYSGLDTKQGIASLKDIVAQQAFGVKPPETGAADQSFGQQVMGAVAPNFNKYSSAVGQLGEGNFSGAANTMGFKSPTFNIPKLPTVAQPVNNGMAHQFED